ncbi:MULTISPECIES: hypothetical protein, partial [Exiguobacterium]
FRFFSMFDLKSDGFYVSTTPYGDEPYFLKKQNLLTMNLLYSVEIHSSSVFCGKKRGASC